MWAVALLFAALPFATPLSDVRVTAPSEDAARALSGEAMTVYDRQGAVVRAYAPAETIAALRARGYVVDIVRADARLDTSQLFGPTRAPGYRTPEEINQALIDLVTANPTLMRLERLGHSTLGVPILGVRLGREDRPAIRVLGGHHGDELPAVEFPVEFL